MVANIWHIAIIFSAIAAVVVAQAPPNDVGVCYGMLGNDLPSSSDVVNLFKQNGFTKTRLFDPNPAALNALRKSNIDVILGVRNEDLPNIAASVDAANSWFSVNVQPYVDDIYFPIISAGNEVIPGPLAQFVLPAMQNLQTVLTNNNLAAVRVSTVVSGATLGTSFPPSSGAFTAEASSTMSEVLTFLSKMGSPLLVNVYPYFAYASDPVNVRLDYAQFTAAEFAVPDGSLVYHNLFDAMVDAFISAMEKAGGANVGVVVSESGWPSGGNGEMTTPQLAQTYNQNLVNHLRSNSGTPKRPNAPIEGYIFAMFNENQKPAGVEQNFGLFFPSMQPVYPMSFGSP